MSNIPPRKNELQELINKDLLQSIDVNVFKREFVTNKLKNTVGLKCGRCTSSEIYVEEKQLRSLDEETTKLYECLTCGNRWRIG
jgi:DNA-directed RNA polymerase subunit M/transcription elongation factor TFIIS